MKAISAILSFLMLVPCLSASAQMQVGPQYRGFSFDEGGSAHLGGVALEAHFPQGRWAWGVELEGMTNSDVKYWISAMVNAGLVIDDVYYYGSLGSGRAEERDYDRSDAGALFGLGVNWPLSRSLRADLSLDKFSEGYGGSASLRYQFLPFADSNRQSYGSSQSQAYATSKSEYEFYLGGGIGRSSIDVDGFDNPTGFNLRGGWMFNPFLAFEASYFNSGKSDDNDGRYTWYLDGDTLQFGVRASTDVRLPWQVYTRVGYALWDFEIDASNTGQGKYSEDGSDLYYAAGVAYSRDASRYFLEYQSINLDTEGENTDVDTLSLGFEYRCCSRKVANNSYSSKPLTPEASPRNQTSYESDTAKTMQVSASSSVVEESLDPVEFEKASSVVDVVTYSPEEEVVVTATAPVHPMKIAIQEGCNVLSVKVVNESQVWDLFCPSTLKRISVTI